MALGQALDHQPGTRVCEEKKRRDRLITQAARHLDWVVGFQDEKWWTRLAQLDLFAWTAGDPLRLGANARDPKGAAPKVLASLANEVKGWVIGGPADVPPAAGRPSETGQGPRRAGGAKKGAEAGEFVLLSQDEARFPMVPTLVGTLGVKGHRSVVGMWNNKGLLYVFGVLNLITGAVHANTLESLQTENRKKAKSKTRQMQRAFAGHLRHLVKAYPASQHERVMLLIDNAPWHRSKLIDEALAESPHLEFKRLPSYSPQLNPVERFWKKLRRRATYNRLFDAIGDLRRPSKPGC